MKNVLEINRIGIFKVSLLYFLMFYHKSIFFLYLENFSLRLEAVDQQKWLQSSSRKDPA